MKTRSLVTALFLAGTALASASVAAAADDPLAKVEFNKALHDRLPDAIKSAGKMTSVENGSFPPYTIVEGTTLKGATADMEQALAKLLGIKIDDANVGGLPALLTGINANRYEMSLGPIGDFKSREGANDFVDWVKEYVVFAVHKGNPQGITSLATSCGHRIAVMAGGSAERVIKKQSETCKSKGKPEIAVQSYTDQPSSILAVRSNRADAFFSSQAPLTYFVEQAHGKLELSGQGQANGFHDLYQGAVVPKGSPLGPVLVDAFKELMKDGAYADIMKKWNLEGNMIDEPAMNLGGVIPK